MFLVSKGDRKKASQHKLPPMTSTMEDKPSSSVRGSVELDKNLGEWSLKANIICRENSKSRRFSGSNIRNFREDQTRSFRPNDAATITSTASSPGHIIRDEIDPSSYSFTTALKGDVMKVKSRYNWEYLTSPDGFALNSKWSEAEKYICNPLSGEVPIECLSAKTLSGRSFNIPNFKSRISTSGPLLYSSSHVQTKPTTIQQEQQHDEVPSPIQEEKVVKCLMTRDAGTQSTPLDISSSSSSPSPTSTPPAKERSLKACDELQGDESPYSCSKSKSVGHDEELPCLCANSWEQPEVEAKREGTRNGEEKRKDKQIWQCRQLGGGGGCWWWLSWRCLRMRKKTSRTETQAKLT